MRIARLELHGFKSFADRTVFHFGAGISCVVGPNGCGKSNVVDALKWVIGEMSAKSLRGEDMLDVIFAGSAERKPVGYAEVALTLGADPEEPFPGDFARYAEVQLARRLYRDGTSEYLVNQARARRKDIVDFLMDSGVGNQLYSFIEQGRIDKIVSASPEDRRSLIDEAAGIVRYRARREETRQKLTATGSQLDRAADVTDEMGRRLATLERQALRAARFRRLRAELRQEEVFLGLVAAQDGAARLNELRVAASALGAEEATLTDTVEQGEVGLSWLEGELGVARAQADLARDALAEADGARRAAEAVAQVLDRQAEDLRRRREAAEETAAREEVRRDAALATHAASASRLAAVEGELAAAEREAEPAAKAAEATRRERAIAESHRRETREEANRTGGYAREGAARREVLAAGLEALPLRLAVLEARRVAVDEEAIVLGKRRQIAAEALAARSAETAALEAEVVAAHASVEEATRRELHARDAVGRAEVEFDAAQAMWTAATEALERAQASAEASVQAAVERVRQVQEQAFVVWERDALAARTREEAAARGRAGDAESAERDAVAATARALQGAAIDARQADEAVFQEEDHRAASEVDLAEASWVARIAEVEHSGRAALADRVSEARQRVTEAEAEVETATRAQADADAQRASALKRLRECEARIAAYEASEDAERRRDGAAAALAAAFPTLGTVLDALEATGRADVATLAAMGPRWRLPLVHPSQFVEVVSAVKGRGALQFVLGGDDGGVDALLGAVEEARDLATVPTRPSRSGRAVVHREAGLRLEPDGLVTLSAGEDDVEDVVARRAAAEADRVARDAAASDVEHWDAASLSARSRAEGARIVARKAREAVDREEGAGRDALRGELDALRGQQDEAMRVARTSYATWRTRRRAALDAVHAQRLRDAEAQLADARLALESAAAERIAQVEQLLEGLRTTFEAARAERRAGVDAAVDVARSMARQDVEAALRGLDERRDRARGEMERFRASVSRARERLPAVLDEVRVARALLDAAQARRADQSRVVARLESEVEASARACDEADARLHQVEEDRAAVERELVAVRAEHAALVERLGDAESLADAAAKAADAAEVAARVATEAEEGARVRWEAIAALRSARLEERSGLLAEAVASERAAADAGARRDEALAALGALSAEIDGAQAERDAAEGAVAQAAAAHQAAAMAWEEARNDHDNLRSRRDEAVERHQAASAQRAGVQRRRLDVEAEQQRLGAELGAVRQRLEERYQIDIFDALEKLAREAGYVLAVPEDVRDGLSLGGKRVDPLDDRTIHPEHLVEAEGVDASVLRRDQLRDDLGKVGEVNLTALEEYEELKVRYDDLEAQRADLDASVQGLRKAIAQLNTLCREKFRETFDAVNEAFKASYPELVGGGEARLELTDEEDLLETGVEIYVRPPGKRMQALSLMSGGEKAMTAIALLLALFSVKPSPFCVLDEVDAPLDEANGARFNEMLRRMATRTQFVVITHNRKTMECADTLYGVTMPTPGCSSLVSVTIEN
jgi:chromosome segregation protein